MTSPKMLRESLCVAQAALGSVLAANPGDEFARRAMRDLGVLIEKVDRIRPLGPNGKHGFEKRCTAACGCDGRDGPYVLFLEGTGSRAV